MRSRFSSERARERALAALTREAAEEATPELDWDRIEAKVLAASLPGPAWVRRDVTHVSGVRRVSPSPAWSSSPWPVAMAAAAAAMLIYADSSRENVIAARPRGQTEPTRSASSDLGAFALGQVAETGAHSSTYDHPGVVNVALAPNSRFEVVANDASGGHLGGITVALARGSLHAEVKPRTDGEIFAVEVERTRIAVHGTSFTVTRKGDQVIVDVAHGSVAVGPVGHRGATHGWLVVGPDRAAFSLDGAREAAWLGAPPADAVAVASTESRATVVVDARSARAKRASLATTPRTRVDLAASNKGEPGASTATPSAGSWGEGAAGEGRDPSEQEATQVASILRQLGLCYEKQVGAFGVRFSVESSLELTLLPSGAIREAVFAPPLSPTLMSCADKAIGGAHFPGGEAARQIRIPVRLSRAPR
jgi:hypothetical protein